MPKVQNYPVYIPFKAAAEDALFLDEAAQSQQITRSAVLRGLIRSFKISAKQEAPI